MNTPLTETTPLPVGSLLFTKTGMVAFVLRSNEGKVTYLALHEDCFPIAPCLNIGYGAICCPRTGSYVTFAAPVSNLVKRGCTRGDESDLTTEQAAMLAEVVALLKEEGVPAAYSA